MIVRIAANVFILTLAADFIVYISEFKSALYTAEELDCYIAVSLEMLIVNY